MSYGFWIFDFFWSLFPAAVQQLRTPAKYLSAVIILYLVFNLKDKRHKLRAKLDDKAAALSCQKCFLHIPLPALGQITTDIHHETIIRNHQPARK